MLIGKKATKLTLLGEAPASGAQAFSPRVLVRARPQKRCGRSDAESNCEFVPPWLAPAAWAPAAIERETPSGCYASPVSVCKVQRPLVVIRMRTTPGIAKFQFPTEHKDRTENNMDEKEPRTRPLIDVVATTASFVIALFSAAGALGQTTYLIDESTNYDTGTCPNGYVDADAVQLSNALAAAGWSGVYWTDSTAWPQDFVESCSTQYGPGYNTEYADKKTGLCWIRPAFGFKIARVRDGSLWNRSISFWGRSVSTTCFEN